MPETAEHPAVTYLLAAHQAALDLALATTPVPVAGEWAAVRDKHADRDAPLTLIQGRDPHEPDFEDYSYGVPVIALSADWQTEAEANLRHIALHDPAAAQRRVAAERELLTACKQLLAVDGWEYDDAPQLAQTVIEGLAKGWGWTA